MNMMPVPKRMRKRAVVWFSVLSSGCPRLSSSCLSGGGMYHIMTPATIAARNPTAISVGACNNTTNSDLLSSTKETDMTILNALIAMMSSMLAAAMISVGIPETHHHVLKNNKGTSKVGAISKARKAQSAK